MRWRAAQVAQPMCGVMQQFFAASSGLSAGGGSVERKEKRGREFSILT
jgi:hypothetical protein